jgi:hypothetical protein
VAILTFAFDLFFSILGFYVDAFAPPLKELLYPNLKYIRTFFVIYKEGQNILACKCWLSQSFLFKKPTNNYRKRIVSWPCVDING